MILRKPILVHQKDDILYLDIGRWLKKTKNHGNAAQGAGESAILLDSKLLMRANANVGEILNIGSGDQLITEADNPAVTITQQKGLVFFIGINPHPLPLLFHQFFFCALPINKGDYQ